MRDISSSGFNEHLREPDIRYRNKQDYLFYLVSAFGKNTSINKAKTQPFLTINKKTRVELPNQYLAANYLIRLTLILFWKRRVHPGYLLVLSGKANNL